MQNLPNILTISRIIITFIFLYFLFETTPSSSFIALVLFIGASITDFFDGYVARKYKIESDFGKLMDPIADKFLVCGAFIALSMLGHIPLWVVAIICGREVGVTVSRMFLIKEGQVVAAVQSGKIKTTLQIATIVIILLFRAPYEWSATAAGVDNMISVWKSAINVLIWLTLAVTLYSGWEYFKNIGKS